MLHNCTLQRCSVAAAGENRYMSTSHGLVAARKRTLLSSVPAVLLIHLKRFDVRSKRDDRVSFGAVLDLRPFCRVDAHSSTHAEYCLIGVIMHRGSRNAGHYWAYVRTVDTSGVEVWLKCDDETVTVVELAHVLDGAGGGVFAHESAYMLLYAAADSLRTSTP
jgi:ubiquitin C-terminal hydrolase